MKLSLSHICLLSVVLVCTSVPAAGQGSETVREQTPPPRANENQIRSTLSFGILGTGDLVVNSASFDLFPGIVTCQGDSVLYDGGSAFGYSAGVTASILPTGLPGFPKLGGMVTLGLRGYSASFEAEEQIGQALLPGDNLVPVISRYEIDASYTALFLDPMLLYRPSTSGLLLLGGPSLGFPIGATYEQREILAEPAEMMFVDGRSERAVGAGDVESPASVLLGIQIGAAWEVGLGGGLSLRPTLLASFGLSDQATDVDWKSHAVRLGFALLFSPEKATSTPLQPE